MDIEFRLDRKGLLDDQSSSPQPQNNDLPILFIAQLERGARESILLPCRTN